MEVFKIENLSSSINELFNEAESGRLSLVLNHGEPLFIAVPFDEMLIQYGVKTALALHLVAEKKISLAQAADLADLLVSEITEKLERKSDK